MYLRTLIGPYAGQVFDFSPEAASAMLADGRAVHPDDDLTEDEVIAEAVDAVVEHSDENRAVAAPAQQVRRKVKGRR